MISPDWLEELGDVTRATRVSGGASKETWAVDVGGEPLIVRRAGGSDIYEETLTLEHEFALLQVAYDAGVKLPRPHAYHPSLGGRAAIVMERVEGETIGRRVVRDPPPQLAEQMGDELARIHSLSHAELGFLAPADPIDTMRSALDALAGQHPALELALVWAEDRLPASTQHVVCHGDWRIGNVVVDPNGLVAVLDWEFARLSAPADDLAFPLVRAWRFGVDRLRFGGVAEPADYVDAYTASSGREVDPAEVATWEMLGNVRWAIACHAQAERHLSGNDRSVELALLGRTASEVELEILDLLVRHA